MEQKSTCGRCGSDDLEFIEEGSIYDYYQCRNCDNSVRVEVVRSHNQ